MEEEEEERGKLGHLLQKKAKGQPSQEEGDEEASPPHSSHCEERIVAIVPPNPLVIKLSAQKKAPETAAPVLGKISSCLQDF